MNLHVFAPLTLVLLLYLVWILSYSRGCYLALWEIFDSGGVATLYLSSSVGRDVLGIPMISRHLFCIDCNSSAKYFGKLPHSGEAYSRSGHILVQYIVMPISVCRFNSPTFPQKIQSLAGFLYCLFNMVIPT